MNLIEKFGELDILLKPLVMLGIFIVLQVIIKIINTLILKSKLDHLKEKTKDNLEFSDDAPSN